MNTNIQKRKEQNGLARFAATAIALCLPVVAALFMSGGLAGFLGITAGPAVHSAHASGMSAVQGGALTGPNVVNISITPNSFVPSDVTIDPGTTVTWTNNTNDRARVRDSQHNLFDSDDFGPGQSFSYTFTTPGVITVDEERWEYSGIVRVTGTPPTGTVGGTGTAQASGTANVTGTAGATGTPGSGMVIVNIVSENFPGYDPANITIQSGTTVRWVNGQDDEHTTTSPGAWDSGEMERGATFDVTLFNNGTYNYFCAFHPDMAGSVTVVGGPTATVGPTNTPAAGNAQVAIQNFAFVPANLNILPGTTVTWTNMDTALHSATSDTGVFNTGNLSQGQSGSYTFNAVGSYPYFCQVHPGMRGTINVGTGGGGTTTATANATSTAQASGTVQATATGVPGSIVDVEARDYTYAPQTITIQAGQTVRWTNVGVEPHSATDTQNPPRFDTGLFNSGEQRSLTFNTPGTYPYFCTLHGTSMSGTIIVQGGGATVTAGPSQTVAPTQPPQATSTPAAGNAQVAIQNFAFVPANLNILPGTTVTWTNMDTALHSATSDTGVFNTGNLSQGQSGSYTFNAVGSYPYFCQVHPGMRGTINVGTGGGTPVATGTAAPPTSTRTAQATTTGTAQPITHDVDIINYAYDPITITVRAGDTVRWTNLDTDPHSVTDVNVPPAYDSGLFGLNGQYSRTFTTPGTYTYYCTLHGTFMTGYVVVQAAQPTQCNGTFTDVPTGHTFYNSIMCLTNSGILSGYADCTFRPNAEVTRGQLSKIVANAAGFSDTPSGQTFQDVAIGSTFYLFVERMASRGIIGGYDCGGTGEPCGSDNKPYFRVNANATRGQIAKIVSNAAGYSNTPSGQTFQDVTPSNTFYLFVERLANRGVMGGYACGGAGEPCGAGNKPYFRPANNATRGQTSKITANTFFPGCTP